MKKISEVLKKMSECAVKVACNTASFNLCGQPKEPESLKNYFVKNKKSYKKWNSYNCKIFIKILF